MASGPNYTTTPTTMAVLLERTDVDKSVKALETLISLFHEYCQLASTIAATNKKLARALKDLAVVKATSQHPANTLSAAAVIFEAAGEIDLKFSKTIEREYDTSMNEVKKWVKKLRKEDKSLDEYTMAANAKIKAAGIAFEKKAKKKDKDALEEHGRYTALLSSLGSEMSSAKHQHALFVTSKHTNTLYSVSASIGRVAESHWSRTCEVLRKSSSAVGPLGESKAYLEGNYTNTAPSDLPSTDQGEGPLTNLSLSDSLSAPGIKTAASTVRESPSVREKDPLGLLPAGLTLEMIADELRNSLALPSPSTAQTPSKERNSSTTSLAPMESTPVLTSSPSQSARSLGPATPTVEKQEMEFTSPNITSSAEPGAVTPRIAEKKASLPDVEPKPAISPAPISYDSPKVYKKSGSQVTTSSTASASVGHSSNDISPPSPDRARRTSPLPRPPSPPAAASIRSDEPVVESPSISSGTPAVRGSGSVAENLARMVSPPPGTVRADRPHSVANSIPFSDVHRPIPRSPVAENPPPGAFDRAMRTKSIDSTNGNFVANMRDRYNDRDREPGYPASPPPPGQGPYRERPPSRVADLASRFSPQSESPGGGYQPPNSIFHPENRFSRSAAPQTQQMTGSSGGRWPSHSSDNLPLRTPLGPPSSSSGTSASRNAPSNAEDYISHGRVRGHDLRAEELELEQKRLELEIQRHRLEARRRESAYQPTGREPPYGGMTDAPSRGDRDRDSMGYGSSGRPQPSRGYTTSPGGPYTARSHSTMPDEGYRDEMGRLTGPGAHPPGCGCYDCVNGNKRYPDRGEVMTPPEETPAKERGGWLKRLSMPRIAADPRSTEPQPRQSRDQLTGPQDYSTRGRRSFDERMDPYGTRR